MYRVPRLSKVIDGTELGGLFLMLKTQLDLARRGELSLGYGENEFLMENGELNSNLRLQLIGQGVTNTKPRGIHPLLTRQLTPVDILLRTLGHLSDCTCFMSALKQAYDLSGDGGNLGMYIALGAETSSFLAYFNALKTQLKVCLNQLLEVSDTIYQQLMEQQRFDDKWNRNET